MASEGANSTAAPAIPDKLYFQIGEVSRLVGLEPHVLRYWEKEFPALAPKKVGKGRRFYRRKDVELLLEIKQLLYDKRFTIEGARKQLENLARQTRRVRAAKPTSVAQQVSLFEPPSAALDQIRAELASILKLLR
ncbi:MAG TPA: MerR family transcriptional regulator [Bryobacteraceae bacterium]|nr:MerR family transcriptional regulator [Bryobacteraceae bacterium]